MIAGILVTRNVEEWVAMMRDIDVPAAPVNSIDKVFTIDQIQSRGMEIEMTHPASKTPIKLVGSPFHMSNTPVSYRLPPPVMGSHTAEVLTVLTGLSQAELADLQAKKII